MNWLSILGLCVLVVFGPATGLLIIAVSLYALLTAWANRVDRREGERLQSSAQRREEAKRLLESRQSDGSEFFARKTREATRGRSAYEFTMDELLSDPDETQRWRTTPPPVFTDEKVLAGLAPCEGCGLTHAKESSVSYRPSLDFVFCNDCADLKSAEVSRAAGRTT